MALRLPASRLPPCCDDAPSTSSLRTSDLDGLKPSSSVRPSFWVCLHCRAPEMGRAVQCGDELLRVGCRRSTKTRHVTASCQSLQSSKRTKAARLSADAGLLRMLHVVRVGWPLGGSPVLRGADLDGLKPSSSLSAVGLVSIKAAEWIGSLVDKKINDQAPRPEDLQRRHIPDSNRSPKSSKPTNAHRGNAVAHPVGDDARSTLSVRASDLDGFKPSSSAGLSHFLRRRPHSLRICLSRRSESDK